MYSISIVRKTNYCHAALVLKSQNRWPYFEIMSILHRQRAFVQMDLIAESRPIYMEIQTCTILHNRFCWHTRSLGTECNCHSLGDSVNDLKTVRSLFLFQYKVSSAREKPYCELKTRGKVLLRNFLLSKPAQLCQNLT